MDTHDVKYARVSEVSRYFVASLMLLDSSNQIFTVKPKKT